MKKWMRLQISAQTDADVFSTVGILLDIIDKNH